MPRYEIEAPNGRIIEMEGDSPPTDKDIDQAFKEVGIDPNTVPREAPSVTFNRLKEQGRLPSIGAPEGFKPDKVKKKPPGLGTVPRAQGLDAGLIGQNAVSQLLDLTESLGKGAVHLMESTINPLGAVKKLSNLVKNTSASDVKDTAFNLLETTMRSVNLSMEGRDNLLGALEFGPNWEIGKAKFNEMPLDTTLDLLAALSMSFSVGKLGVKALSPSALKNGKAATIRSAGNAKSGEMLRTSQLKTDTPFAILHKNRAEIRKLVLGKGGWSNAVRELDNPNRMQVLGEAFRDNFSSLEKAEITAKEAIKNLGRTAPIDGMEITKRSLDRMIDDGTILSNVPNDMGHLRRTVRSLKSPEDVVSFIDKFAAESVKSNTLLKNELVRMSRGTKLSGVVETIRQLDKALPYDTASLSRGKLSFSGELPRAQSILRRTANEIAGSSLDAVGLGTEWRDINSIMGQRLQVFKARRSQLMKAGGAKSFSQSFFKSSEEVDLLNDLLDKLPGGMFKETGTPLGQLGLEIERAKGALKANTMSMETWQAWNANWKNGSGSFVPSFMSVKGVPLGIDQILSPLAKRASTMSLSAAIPFKPLSAAYSLAKKGTRVNLKHRSADVVEEERGLADLRPGNF